jgi:hypothetical protein
MRYWGSFRQRMMNTATKGVGNGKEAEAPTTSEGAGLGNGGGKGEETRALNPRRVGRTERWDSFFDGEVR